MKKRSKLVSMRFLLLFVFVAGCSSPRNSPNMASSSHLCHFLAADLDYIHSTLSANCSNYHGDRETQSRSDAVYAAESRDTSACRSDLDYIRSIRKYVASFHDPHISATWGKIPPDRLSFMAVSMGREVPPSQLALKYAATGIYLQKYENSCYVNEMDRALLTDEQPIQVGDELKGCDGRTPDEILETEILPFESVSARESTYYSDIRFESTPSGLPFMFPTKADSGDPLGRRSGVALEPNLPLHYDVQQEMLGSDSLRRSLEEVIESAP